MIHGLAPITRREFSEALERERDRIRLDLDELVGADRELARGRSDEGDSTEESADVEVARTRRQLLTEVEAALERLAAGCYGICLECGALIGESRLRVQPWTTTCLRCALRQGGPPRWNG